MVSHKIEYYPYKDDKYFSHEKREQYFNDVEPSFLNESVILIDPDNGFEVKSMRSGNGHKYLKYNELSEVYGRMSSNSLVLVYQHIPRVKREDHFAQVGQRIRRFINTRNPICLTDNSIAFFITAKTDALLDRTWAVLTNYAKENGYKVYRCDDDFGMESGF